MTTLDMPKEAQAEIVPEQAEVTIKTANKTSLIQYLLAGTGCLVISLALVSYFTQMDLASLITWVEQAFSFTFILIFMLLVSLSLHAGFKVKSAPNHEFWYELGQQAANGIATLSLTFTLLGISLGIGALSETKLSPETVGTLIGQLTSQFSMAFITTIIGLPSANLMRAWVSIRATQHEQNKDSSNTAV